VALYAERGLHGQIVHELAGRIMSGSLAPGQVLDLSALESELDISRTVLRESLKVLAAKGLVDARQKRGTFVRPRGEWNLLDADVIRWRFTGAADRSFLDDLHEVRSIIEPASARLAAGRRTDEDLAMLERALAAMSAAASGESGEGNDPVESDLAFHRALLAATHNELLQRMEVVLEAGLARRDRLVHNAPSAQDPVPSHQAVLDALRAQRPDRAEQAMRALLEQARRDLLALEATTAPGARTRRG
jgi:DNA-binding FadR family transcriptional regulator